VEKSLRDISGGEQRRLSLAILVASGANVLILDEPTNHLDIESREALEDALTAYEGAVILVSHDRALLEAVGSRTIVCEDGELRSHPSGWAGYQRQREEDEEAAASAAAEAKRSAKGKSRRSGPSPKAAARKAGRLAEGIEAAEAALRALEEELADPAAWSTPAKAEEAGERHEAAKRELAALYEQWEEAESAVSAAGDRG
jgi:ATP-binding cassette, subfamily F, member 3